MVHSCLVAKFVPTDLTKIQKVIYIYIKMCFQLGLTFTWN